MPRTDTERWTTCPECGQPARLIQLHGQPGVENEVLGHHVPFLDAVVWCWTSLLRQDEVDAILEIRRADDARRWKAGHP